MRLRMVSANSSSRKWWSEPATSLRKSFGSQTRKSKVPKARTRTMPKSGSRSITGLLVPHLLPVNSRVLTKYTSALNGDSNPYFQPCSVDRIGMLSVVRLCLPGPKVSPNWPR